MPQRVLTAENMSRSFFGTQVHGVNDVFQETPEFVADRIRAIKEELTKYPLSKRRAFDRACFLKPSLGNDEKVYLLFLRAERFDVPPAARKLCLHFEHKWELFGEAKLPKNITLDDLDEDDMAALRTGSYIILPKKDRAGRRVGVINLPPMQFKHWKNQVRNIAGLPPKERQRLCFTYHFILPQVRSSWYSIFNELLADEDVQKRGTIDVMYFVDMKGIPDSMLTYVRDSHHILSEMPCRPCGFHVCYNNNLIRPFLSFLHMVTSKDRKLRERLHFGSHLEVQYELCTFGIDLQYKNFDQSDGVEYIETFLDSRRQIEAAERRQEEEEQARTGVILHPTPIDVICGRGKPYQDFPGNLRVGRIVDETVPLYLETHERLAKTMIAMGIVQQVQKSGGRFLTRRDDGWELAQDKVARGKISQALRVRALKKIRNEGLEPERLPDPEDRVTPSPEPLGSRELPDNIASREVKRQRFSNEVDEMTIESFDSPSLGEVIV
jgi:hypothetical protein